MSDLLSLFGDFNDAQVLFLGGLPRWVLLLLGLVAAVVLAFSWIDLRDLGLKRRIFLVGLRALALGAALLLLLEPALELRHVSRIKNHVLFLVDTSLSMTLPHEGRESRWQAAQAFLEGSSDLITEPNEQHEIELFRFDEGLHPTTLEELQSAQPRGRSTQILEALEAVTDTYARQDLGGIVIASDGTDSGALSGRVRPGEPLDAETQAMVDALGVPIHTVAFGRPEEVRDLAVERVFVDDFAFVRNRVAIEVRIRAVGFGEGLAPVTLRREGAVLQTREIELTSDQSEYHVTFEFIPEQIGKEIYTVQLPFLAQELIAENNEAHFILKVIRDKIRVLQVCGRPSWDERFLRELLKRNPNVDLISFFILRTDADLQLAPNAELSLIPFPTEELFEEQLGSFDLVIFQNFTYRPYGMFRYLDRIREYVEGGGAFVMIGGEQAFASGGYTGTAVGDLLPVFLPPEGPSDGLVDLAPFRPALTEAGQHHPITRLEFNPADNLRAWEALPEIHGTNLVRAPRPEATVLLQHPALEAGGEPLPVLSVAEMGDGRTMALTTDSTWRWSFTSVGRGGTSRAYTSFWNSAIRWLIQDPELRLIQVETPQDPIEPGAPFEAAIRVLRPDYQPASDVSGSWELRFRPLDALDDPSRREVVQSADFMTDARGRIDLSLQVEREGAYELWATAEQEVTGPLSDEDIFLALADRQELRDILPRPDLLEALSEASGSAAQSGPSLEPEELAFAEARTVRVNRRRLLEVWSSPWILVGLALLLGTEWALRRRWGRL